MPDLIQTHKQLAQSTRLLKTDLAGSVLGEHARVQTSVPYMPYGYLGASKSGLYFNGQWLEPAIQGYLLGNGYRAYGPTLMRFYSPDELSPFKRGGINAYAYCNGDPINLNDPLGRAGQKTGLTRLLKTYGLPKKDLKAHLNLLNDPRSQGRTIDVVRVHERQATTFQFSFADGKFNATVISESPFNELSGNHFVKGNTYIPAPPEKNYHLLTMQGFEKKMLVPDTHAFISGVQPAPVQSGSSRGAGSHGYLTLSDAATGLRQNK
ncbi:RHS repeat-associated core domain-containing protein [Pseudomonas fakonensis]|uniref:RHS repeat-associated core domain-containing protein n=1 Tax=Pseudomonas fakonensis TaxID=2842355 RepID=A0ABX8N101_9PSED|nr:RHS repeat-associated core domain-containing protein [Pseudomonas fakonensis]QXH50002.1 RHS repeat-associated core domain-containing protein [Pseudomonas fakonensis]